MTTSIMGLSAKAPTTVNADPVAKVVEATMLVKPYKAIHTDIVADITFVQSDKCFVEARGSERLIRNTDIKVDEDGTMHIAFDEEIRKIRNEIMSLTIYGPKLMSIVSSGVGNFKVDGALDTPELSICINGVGNVRIDDLTCQKLQVSNTGVGNVNLEGTTQEATYNSEGVGSINAYGMHAQKTSVKLDGVGSIQCHASELIDCVNSGVGSVSYKGDPAKENIQKNGIGSIKKK